MERDLALSSFHDCLGRLRGINLLTYLTDYSVQCTVITRHSDVSNINHRINGHQQSFSPLVGQFCCQFSPLQAFQANCTLPIYPLFKTGDYTIPFFDNYMPINFTIPSFSNNNWKKKLVRYTHAQYFIQLLHSMYQFSFRSTNIIHKTAESITDKL